MFSPLRMCEIGAIVLVHGEAEPAFKGADVVFEKVRVFVQVDGLEGELPETFTPVGVCT